jgi:hypothetical protein
MKTQEKEYEIYTNTLGPNLALTKYLSNITPICGRTESKRIVEISRVKHPNRFQIVAKLEFEIFPQPK